MKTLLLTCLILINCSCGKRNNDFSKRNYFQPFEQDDSLNRNGGSLGAPMPMPSPIIQQIQQIEVPQVRLIESSFILSNNRNLKFQSHIDGHNLYLRNQLVKEVAKNFRGEKIKMDLFTSPTYLAISEKQLYEIKGDRSTTDDILRYDQVYKIHSDINATTFQNIQASLGSPKNVIDMISLSLNQQQIDEVITNQNSIIRNFKTSHLKHNSIKHHLENKNPIHIILNDYFINNSQEEYSYQEKKELLLKNNYELVVSTAQSTKVYYIPEVISFKEALTQICNNQLVIDQSAKIVSLKGELNNFQNPQAITMSSRFIKLINFENQNLNETPKAGMSYAIVQFQLSDVNKFAPIIKRYNQKLHFSDFKQDISTRIPKDFFSSLSTKMFLEKKDYKIVKSTINAFVLVPKGFGIKEKKCKVYKYSRSLVDTKNIPAEVSLSVQNKHIKYDVIYTSKESHKSLIQVNTATNAIDLKLKKNTAKLKEGIIGSNCKKGIKKLIIDSKTKKAIKFYEKEVPASDYTLNLEITERGNIY